MTDPLSSGTDRQRTTETLGTALPREMARVRDEVMPPYLELRGTPGVNVEFALGAMRNALDAAARAMAEGDVIAMLAAYENLKGYST